MPKIADDFARYIEETFPEIPGFEEHFNEETIQELIHEVRDLLSEDPPNMAGVLDLANELNFADKVKRQIMDDMKEYMSRTLGEILD